MMEENNNKKRPDRIIPLTRGESARCVAHTDNSKKKNNYNNTNKQCECSDMIENS